MFNKLKDALPRSGQNESDQTKPIDTPEPPYPGAIPIYNKDGKLMGWEDPEDKDRELIGR